MKNLAMMSWDQLETEVNEALKHCREDDSELSDDPQFTEAVSEALRRDPDHALCIRLPGCASLHIDPVNETAWIELEN